MLRDYGDQALLLECDSTGEVLAWAKAIKEADLPDVLDIVPAARTVLVTLAAPRAQTSARRQLAGIRLENIQHAPAGGRADVVIDVVYDGADLAEVGRLTGLSAADVVAAHTGTPWRVGFGGFAPGFAYLVEGDPRLEVPRRSEPRTTVPAGAVGLAGEFSGVYPRQSPGGWQLIGHTEAALWDIDRPNPALLAPGMWVQFRAV
ncbi:5-oxoprolinase subunit B family protein [Mycolicibacterium komossense]|uniref:Allophanate hydrolase subunit 1 n=1 Tax=Mycolicibacterium komossense TaxID=1779 RepID=A0ABT3C835_9MYCO|nr:allophanate hydrolase subunit 1 [Mycolicibacterium komossense]MCV7225617.1 allophanate hydrolase subunit 1 [Mycolicibacterium komossense]